MKIARREASRFESGEGHHEIAACRFKFGYPHQLPLCYRASPPVMKPRASILTPDTRFANMAGGRDKTGAIRPMAITDLYDQMAEIQLSAAIPADILEQFEKAKYAYIIPGSPMSWSR